MSSSSSWLSWSSLAQVAVGASDPHSLIVIATFSFVMGQQVSCACHATTAIRAEDLVPGILQFVGDRTESLCKAINKEKKSLDKIYKQWTAMCQAEKKANKTKSEKDKKDYAKKQEKFFDMLCKANVGWFVKYVAKEVIDKEAWDAGIGEVLSDKEVQKRVADCLRNPDMKQCQKLKESLEKVGPKATKKLLAAIGKFALKQSLNHLRDQLDYPHPYEHAEKDINDSLQEADEIQFEDKKPSVSHEKEQELGRHLDPHHDHHDWKGHHEHDYAHNVEEDAYNEEAAPDQDYDQE